MAFLPAMPDESSQQMSIRDMFANPTQVSATFDEAQLEKDKERLRGVPFVITRVTYQLPKADQPRGYVTVEAVVADELTIMEQVKAGRVPGVDSLEGLQVQPETKVLINDGSTGIRRQLTGLFDAQGLIVVGKVGTQADYDRSWLDWQGFSQTAEVNDPNVDGGKVTIPEISVDRNGRPLMIVVRHGLRLSVEPSHDANVYYLS